MSNSRPCRHELLARNGIAKVKRCMDCGGVSLHLGPVTLQLDERALEAVSHLLLDATRMLRARDQGGVLMTSARGLA